MSMDTGAPADQCLALTNINGVHTTHLPIHIIEWQYVWDENTGGDYAKAAMVIDRKFASKALCACGKQLEINYKGEVKVVENE